MREFVDRSLVVVWFIFAVINLFAFVVCWVAQESTFQPSVWFAISVLFIRLWFIDRQIKGLR